MRVLLVLSTDVFVEKAHVFSTFKTCESFAKNGHEITLLVPGYFTLQNKKNVQTLFDKYNVKHPFTVKGVPVFRGKAPFPLNKISGWIFGGYTSVYALLTRPTFVLSRDLGFSSVFVRLRELGMGKNIPFAYEVHDFHSLSETDPTIKKAYFDLEQRIMKSADAIVVLMDPVKQLIAKRGIDTDKVAIAPVGVDLSLFEKISRDHARKKFKLGSTTNVVLYAGHLYAWKGIYVLAKAMKEIPDAECWLVGGLDEDQEKMREFLKHEKITNVLLKGKVPPKDVPFYMKAADVGIVPTTAKNILGKEDTKGKPELTGFGTPMKLLEYMAAYLPVVVSNIPAHQEALNEKSAILVKPDSAHELAEGIREALDDKKKSQSRALAAYKIVVPYDWMNRCIPIVQKIRERFPNSLKD